MLPSNWLRSGSYCAMYSVFVQCNACTFPSFFLIKSPFYDHLSIILRRPISLFSEILILCCLRTVWALVLLVKRTVYLYSVMHVHFTVCLFDDMHCQSIQLKLILTSISRSEAISSTLKCLVVYLNWTWERHYKAQNIITICKYLQIWLEAHSLVVKNLLKLNEMCTFLFV